MLIFMSFQTHLVRHESGNGSPDFMVRPRFAFGTKEDEQEPVQETEDCSCDMLMHFCSCAIYPVCTIYYIYHNGELFTLTFSKMATECSTKSYLGTDKNFIPTSKKNFGYNYIHKVVVF